MSFNYVYLAHVHGMHCLHFTSPPTLLQCFILESVPRQYIEICLILLKSCMVFWYMGVLYILGSVDGVWVVYSLNKGVITVFLHTCCAYLWLHQMTFKLKRKLLNPTFLGEGTDLQFDVAKVLYVIKLVFKNLRVINYQFLSCNLIET